MLPILKHHDTGSAARAIDLLKNILEQDQTGEHLATHMAQEIQRLTGAQSVLCVKCSSDLSCRAFSGNGANSWTSPTTIDRFTEIARTLEAPKVWMGKDSSETATMLRAQGFDVSAAIPLASGGSRKGALFLLGLPDKRQLDVILEQIVALGPVVTLVLQNQYLRENREQLISERTREIHDEHHALLRQSEESRAALLSILEDAKLAQEALREKEFWMEQTQRVARVGSYVVNVKQETWTSSTVWDEIFGIGENFEKNLSSWGNLIHPEDREQTIDFFHSNLRLKGEFRKEYRILRQNDSAERWVLAIGTTEFDKDGVPLRVYGTVQDITDRRQLEDQLRQMQKIEAIGQLAGGVAHDFNNILAATMMQVDLLRSHPQLTEDMRELVSELELGAQRAASLTRQLLTFSRRQILQIKRLDLSKAVGSLMKMLQRLLGEDVKLSVTTSEDSTWLEGDIATIEQIVINLCVNARDAMPHGGELKLGVRCVEIDTPAASANPEARAGRFVCLSVADTGCGMDESTLKRVFEPFFTTKEVGKGTGLGLATVHGIVKQHKGWIEVESTPGVGTVFQVFLPACDRSPEPAKPVIVKTVPGGREMILLVEDDESVRRVTAKSLRSLGYQVIEASSGVEAMKRWNEMGGQIALILTDMIMPEGMSGMDLIKRLRESYPELKAIISSGYSTEITRLGSIASANVSYLPKPYQLEHLAALIRKSLGDPQGK